MKKGFVIIFILAATTTLFAQKPIVRNTYYGIGIAGDSADVKTKTEFGVVLMGGSTDVDEAFQWMVKLSGGGDFVIIRASGSTGYNDYVKAMGSNSVETLMIDSREKAMSKEVGKRLREAEALFIAGGDQWNYVNFWADSEVSSAIHYLVHEKKIPIGGTSAGCAVLSGICFDARHDTSVSKEVLANPFHQTVSLSPSFIQIPFLQNVIADQHYSQRERQGRHVVFLARTMTDGKASSPRGVGVDEKTAVCIDASGEAVIYGKGNAHFLVPQSRPEVCKENTPLEWNAQTKAIAAYVFSGTPTGTKAFNLNQWPQDKPDQYWSVTAGLLQMN
jgi:cyanophycinase